MKTLKLTIPEIFLFQACVQCALDHQEQIEEITDTNDDTIYGKLEALKRKLE